MRRVNSEMVLWTLTYVAIEGLLYLSYESREASFHWFIHYFAGAVFALLVMSIYTGINKRPIRLPLLWLLTAHLIAMMPDFLFSILKIAHARWMDIFMLHVSSHFIPGRNATWYVLFLLSLGTYLATVYLVQDNSNTADY